MSRWYDRSQSSREISNSNFLAPFACSHVLVAKHWTKQASPTGRRVHRYLSSEQPDGDLETTSPRCDYQNRSSLSTLGHPRAMLSLVGNLSSLRRTLSQLSRDDRESVTAIPIETAHHRILTSDFCWQVGCKTVWSLTRSQQGH